MIYGLFFAAGKQSRFGITTPKALSLIGNKVLLDCNFKNIEPFVDKSYVVCSNENAYFFDKYPKIAIDSGKGCGDAVMKALYSLNPSADDFCYVQWGDSFVNDKLYPLIKNNAQTVKIPCYYESNPYVQVIPDGETVKIKFSKYEKTDDFGLHDQSVFYMPAQYALKELIAFAGKITENGQYRTKHNNEMLFLDLFNEMGTKAQIVENTIKSFSFNTLKELRELNNGR